MHIIVDYLIGYREVHTTHLARNDGENFLRAFSAAFGLNPDMYGGEATRSWSTPVIRHKFQVEVIIPRKYLVSLTE